MLYHLESDNGSIGNAPVPQGGGRQMQDDWIAGIEGMGVGGGQSQLSYSFIT